MADLLDRIVVPVASAAEARATGRAIRSDDSSTVVAVHVIEQTAGTPDTASPERLEERALEIFDELAAVLGATEFETDLRYGTDVGETIIEAAGDHDATAVVFTPRGGSRWIRLLTGSVAETLVERADRPVVVLPDVDSED